MPSVSDSAGTAPPDTAACPSPRAPGSCADLQKQATTFRSLLAAPDSVAPEDQEGEGAAMLGASLSPQQALAMAALAQRQPGQQQPLQPQADADATACAEDSGPTPLPQGMSASGFALWRRLQDQHPGGQGDASAALQAPQLAASDTAAAAAAPTADPEGAFAALVEKHVRQMLVTLPTLGQRSGEVQIRLSEAVLPDTSLSLVRTDSGWQLRAQSDSSDSLQALRKYAPALVTRFAQRKLGALEIQLD